MTPPDEASPQHRRNTGHRGFAEFAAHTERMMRADRRIAELRLAEEIDRHIERTRRRWLLIGLVAGLVVGWAAGARAETIEGGRIAIIDGDTVALPGGERIRILNIDAPESHRPRCEAELVAGLAAKAALRDLLAGPVDAARCEPSGRCLDRYGRTLARLIGPGGDIGESLIRAGHALPWAPGAQASAARLKIWCGP